MSVRPGPHQMQEASKNAVPKLVSAASTKNDSKLPKIVSITAPWVKFLCYIGVTLLSDVELSLFIISQYVKVRK
jgi:hypothetical protein